MFRSKYPPQQVQSTAESTPKEAVTFYFDINQNNYRNRFCFLNVSLRVFKILNYFAHLFRFELIFATLNFFHIFNLNFWISKTKLYKNRCPKVLTNLIIWRAKSWKLMHIHEQPHKNDQRFHFLKCFQKYSVKFGYGDTAKEKQMTGSELRRAVHE